MTLAARLTELGLALPDVVVPLGAYAPAVVAGGQVLTSGQLPMVDGALPATGKVGVGDGLVPPEQAHDLARQAALNAIAAAAAVAGGVDRLGRVVKVVGFVASDPAFTGHPAVVNGASHLLNDVFGDAGVHARSAVGVAALPLDSPVEVEVVFELA